MKYGFRHREDKQLIARREAEVLLFISSELDGTFQIPKKKIFFGYMKPLNRCTRALHKSVKPVRFGRGIVANAVNFSFPNALPNLKKKLRENYTATRRRNI